MIASADRNIAAQGGDAVLARTIFAEARDQSRQGQIAVAYVVKHRAEIAAAYKARTGKNHLLYGDGTIVAACLWSNGGIYQFSCWSPGDKNRAVALKATHTNPAFCEATLIAHDVLAGKVHDDLPGTTHYLNPKLAAPRWAKGLSYHSIGDHRFYRNVP